MFGKLIGFVLRFLFRIDRERWLRPRRRRGVAFPSRLAVTGVDDFAAGPPPPAPACRLDVLYDEGRRAAIERGVWAATPPESGVSVRLVSARPEAAAMSEMMGGSVAVSVARAGARAVLAVGRMTLPGARTGGARPIAVSVVRPLPGDAAGDAEFAEQSSRTRSSSHPPSGSSGQHGEASEGRV